jgi:hypothetical protein
MMWLGLLSQLETAGVCVCRLPVIKHVAILLIRVIVEEHDQWFGPETIVFAGGFRRANMTYVVSIVKFI